MSKPFTPTGRPTLGVETPREGDDTYDDSCNDQSAPDDGIPADEGDYPHRGQEPRGTTTDEILHKTPPFLKRERHRLGVLCPSPVTTAPKGLARWTARPLATAQGSRTVGILVKAGVSSPTRRQRTAVPWRESNPLFPLLSQSAH